MLSVSDTSMSTQSPDDEVDRDCFLRDTFESVWSNECSSLRYGTELELDKPSVSFSIGGLTTILVISPSFWSSDNAQNYFEKNKLNILALLFLLVTGNIFVSNKKWKQCYSCDVNTVHNIEHRTKQAKFFTSLEVRWSQIPTSLVAHGAGAYLPFL